MDRILEPELMVDEAQTLAYAQADFDQVNQGFVDRYRASFPRGIDRKSTRLNSSHSGESRMPSSA